MCPCMFRMLLHCLTGWFRSRCRLGDKSKSKVVWGFVVAFAFLCALNVAAACVCDNLRFIVFNQK